MKRWPVGLLGALGFGTICALLDIFLVGEPWDKAIPVGIRLAVAYFFGWWWGQSALSNDREVSRRGRNIRDVRRERRRDAI